MFNVGIKDPGEPSLLAVMEPEEVNALNASSGHIPHCLPGGEVMISTTKDTERNNRGKHFHIISYTVCLIGIARKSIHHNFCCYKGTV